MRVKILELLVRFDGTARDSVISGSSGELHRQWLLQKSPVPVYTRGKYIQCLAQHRKTPASMPARVDTASDEDHSSDSNNKSSKSDVFIYLFYYYSILITYSWTIVAYAYGLVDAIGSERLYPGMEPVIYVALRLYPGMEPGKKTRVLSRVILAMTKR